MKTLEFDARDPYFYNPIINSNFEFWQRVGNSAANRSHNSNPQGYSADRFLNALSPGVAKSAQIIRSTSVPPSVYPAKFSMQFTNNLAVPSFPASEFVDPLEQRIEGLFLQPLVGGPTTLGMWIFPSFSGIITLASQRNGNTRSFVSTATVVANQWQYIISHVPYDTTGPAQTIDSGLGYRIIVGLVGGTATHATALDTWLTGDVFSHASATNYAATAGTFIRFSQVQIRSGTRGVDEMKNGYVPHAPSYQGELSICRRYYEKTFDVDTIPLNLTNNIQGALESIPAVTGGRIWITWWYKTEKRANPLGTFFSIETNTPGDWTANGLRPTGTVFDGLGPNSALIYSTLVNTTANNAYFIHAAADSEI